MTIAELDPRRTFESFVIGPANRLASAAARRAADSPGTSYNPLFIYSAPGLGKSHLLVATAHRAKKVNPDLRVGYLALDSGLDGIVRALEAGQADAGLAGLDRLDMLLLDDVELLAGRKPVEEHFVHVLTILAGSGAQLVLGSNQAPSEIRGLDHRLISRFSGGLIVDIALPEFETRVGIVRRMVEDRGGRLEAGVAELLGRVSAHNVRELSGIINRIMQVQEVEGRLLSPDGLPELLSKLDLREGDEFGTFVDELAQDVATTVEVAEAPWRRILREALDAGEREGYNCGRLRHLLEQPTPPPDTRHIVETFTGDVDRLRAIRAELKRLGDPWPEAALGVLRDPDRMKDAEGLLTSAQELTRAYPPVPPVPESGNLPALNDGVGAEALKLLEPSGVRQGLLFLWSPESTGARLLLARLGNAFVEQNPEGRVAYISVRDFAEDFIRALTSGVAGAWRERWWKVELLLVERLQDLAGTERARDELFHLFEAVQRGGGRIALAADRPPSRIAGIDDRIRKRLEGGVVLEVECDEVPALASGMEDPVYDPVLGGHLMDDALLADFPDVGTTLDVEPAAGRTDDGFLEIDPASIDALGDLLVDGAAPIDPGPGLRKRADGRGRAARSRTRRKSETAARDDAGSRSAALAGWQPTNEDVVWEWPRIEELLVEEHSARPQARNR